MSADWKRRAIWFWLAGAVGWLVAVTIYVYDQTNGFSLHLGWNEWKVHLLLWSLPPLSTFLILVLMPWVGHKIWIPGVLLVGFAAAFATAATMAVRHETAETRAHEAVLAGAPFRVTRRAGLFRDCEEAAREITRIGLDFGLPYKSRDVVGVVDQ